MLLLVDLVSHSICGGFSTAADGRVAVLGDTWYRRVSGAVPCISCRGGLTLVGLLGGSGGGTLNGLRDLVANVPDRRVSYHYNTAGAGTTYLRVSIILIVGELS